jgi:hypothetical protein
MANMKLPAGFKPISGLGEAWKPTKVGETVHGVLHHVKVVHLPKKGKQPARDWNIYTIRTKAGDVEVGESAGLRALAKVKKGREVFIQYLGKKKIGGGRQPMRDFLVATK